MSVELRRWSGRAYDRATRPLQSWSLTWRLVVVTVGLLLGALLLTGMLSQALLRSSLMNRSIEGLQAAASIAASTTRAELSRGRHVYESTIPSSYAIVFMDDSGRGIDVKSSLDEPRAFPQVPAIAVEESLHLQDTPFVVSSQDGANPRWLVLAGPLRDGSGTFAVATSLRGVEATVAWVQAVSLLIGLLVAGACALVGWLGIKRAFRPLREMEDTAAAIADGDLTRRVPEHTANDEVASLSRSLNAMLTHIEQSFAVREASEERMRRFVTDASHELRTPLATVRGYAELYRQGAVQTPEAMTGAMRRIEDEATRMSGLVDDLLTLARLDNHRPPRLGEVDLTVLAADAVGDAKAREPGRPIRVIGLGDEHLAPALLVGDEARLRQVVTNLVANAVQHTPADSPVEIAVGRLAPAPESGGDEQEDGSADASARSGRKRIRPPGRGVAWSRGTLAGDAPPASSGPNPAAGTPAPHPGGPGRLRLEVRDHGRGIPAEDVERVFQRFYRGDPSRGRASGGGTGLGLAIVLAIVSAHGGRVGIRPTAGGGSTFVVELPLTPPGWVPPAATRPANAPGATEQPPGSEDSGDPSTAAGPVTAAGPATADGPATAVGEPRHVADAVDTPPAAAGPHDPTVPLTVATREDHR